MRRLALVAALVAFSYGTAQAGNVTVQDAWARATAPNAKTGAAYLSITSKGDDALTGASTPVAAKAQVHQTYKNGEVVGMRPIANLPLSKSGPTVLVPGGYHIMLMDLKQGLVKGGSFPLTLSFEKAGSITTTVHVEAAGANGPTQDLGPGHDMDTMPETSH